MVNLMPLAQPVLALPRLDGQIPLSLVATSQSLCNAALCNTLIASGFVEEQDLPDQLSDPLRACESAISTWIKREIGPLHCLHPRFAIEVLDARGVYPAMRDGQQTPYGMLDVYWCEYSEAEWPVGRKLEALNEAMPHLGATVLQVLRQQSLYVYPLLTPDIAVDMASMIYWHGEEDEEAALDMMCDEGDEADREAMRDEMVTRQMLNDAYPEWGQKWVAHAGKGVKGRRRPHPCSLTKAVKTLAEPLMRQIAVDALALSRLALDDTFRPDMEGEYIGFGAVLSWKEGDVTTRIYDDVLNLAHQGEYCDRMGEQQIAMDDPDALAAFFHRMSVRFEAIGLIDRLIHALSD